MSDPPPLLVELVSSSSSEVVVMACVTGTGSSAAEGEATGAAKDPEGFFFGFVVGDATGAAKDEPLYSLFFFPDESVD